MFVVDSTDRKRIMQVDDKLWRYVRWLPDIAIIIMANKQDLPNAMSIAELTGRLGLNMIKDKTWRKLYINLYLKEFFHRYPAIMCSNRRRTV